MTNNADALRGMANGPHPGLSYSAVEALLAGAAALDSVAEQAETIQTLSRLLTGAEAAAIERAAQIERVRAALTDLRGQQEAALQRWDDTTPGTEPYPTPFTTPSTYSPKPWKGTLNDHEH